MADDTPQISPQAASEGLIGAVVNLVGTGPVPLGSYTLAEIAAVDGVIEHLETEPADELIAEAVRSLAARQLITTAPDQEHVEVRGDLGVALAFQQRAPLVLDARVTATAPDEPWRFLLLPQAEGITLEVLIDALGIHVYSLRQSGDALDRLWERLPTGDRGPRDADAPALLAGPGPNALLSATREAPDGTLQTTDVVLCREGETGHVFLRDPDDPERLVAHDLDGDGAKALVAGLLQA